MSVSYFNAFASPLPEALFLISNAGTVLAVNPAALRMLEARRDQVAGRSVAELVADPKSHVADFLAASSRTSRFTIGTLTWCTTTGLRVDCRMEGAFMPDANDGALLLRAVPKEFAAARFMALNEKIRQLAREVMERKQAEEEALRSRQRLESVLEHSAAAVWLKDAAGRYVLVNRRFRQMAGNGFGEIAGRTDFDLFPREAALEFAEHDRLVLERRECLEFEEAVPGNDGGRIYLSLRFPVPDPVTLVHGVGGISTDITERKRLEEQLRETQKLESLGVLAGGVAHDFNNLLTGIMGSASLVLESMPTDDPARPAIDEMLHASERAAHLTRQMLAYAGKGRFVVERLDLSETVADIAKLVRISVPHNVELRLNLAKGLPAVEADPGQMQQIVMNLVINGAEAIGEDKTGVVVVTTASQHLDAEYIRENLPGEDLAPGDYVFLEVHDNGIGMDATTRARIFDPFFTTKFTGRGLGLSAVLGIVRGHRGSVRVYSTPGGGSTFKVLFPVVAGTKRPLAQPAIGKDLRGSGGVLVVDDEEIVRRTARIMLERYGYTVFTAENGLEAVHILRRNEEHIRLVLLDLTMPVMSGEDAFGQLRGLAPGIPILLSSGYNEVEAIRRFTSKGVSGFIQKPYTSTRLAEKVKSVLAGSAPAWPAD
jgi:PAS domain S-box-containing protein